MNYIAAKGFASFYLLSQWLSFSSELGFEGGLDGGGGLGCVSILLLCDFMKGFRLSFRFKLG